MALSHLFPSSLGVLTSGFLPYSLGFPSLAYTFIISSWGYFPSLDYAASLLLSDGILTSRKFIAGKEAGLG